MSASKLVIWSHRTEFKILVEFIPDVAPGQKFAFSYRQSNHALANGNLHGLVIHRQGFIQVTARKKKAKPLGWSPEAMKLKLWPSSLDRSAKDPVRVKNNQSRLTVPVADASGDDLLAPTILKCGQCEVFKMTRVPILRDRSSFAVEDGYLGRIEEVILARNDNAPRLRGRSLQDAKAYRSEKGRRTL